MNQTMNATNLLKELTNKKLKIKNNLIKYLMIIYL